MAKVTPFHNNIAYGEGDTIPQLLLKVKVFDVPKVFEIEQATGEYCKKNDKSIVFLRLPVAHSELNAIELIWANVKGEVTRKNKTFKMKDVKMLMEKALANVEVEEWVNAIKQTEKVEEKYWRMDFLLKMPITLSLIIRVDPHEDSETEPEFDEDDLNETVNEQSN